MTKNIVKTFASRIFAENITIIEQDPPKIKIGNTLKISKNVMLEITEIEKYCHPIVKYSNM